MVDNLLHYIGDFLLLATELAIKNEIKIIILGRKDRLPAFLLTIIDDAHEKTKTYSKHILNVAIDYSGRDEISRACVRVLESGISKDNLSVENFEQYLDTAHQPYPHPDILIRTSGDQRNSDFMAWQLVFTELYFTKILFPDFDAISLKEAIIDFSKRTRRFSR